MVIALLPENLLEVQILLLWPKPAESETLQMGPEICVLTSFPIDYFAY